MSVLVRVAQTCTAVRRAVTAFFSHDLTVRRDAAGVRIVFQSRRHQRRVADVASVEASRTSAIAVRLQQDLALVRSQLAELLDTSPGARGSMRHLVFVEQALARKGLQAVHSLPLDVLRQALEQIESMVTNWSPAGLANLRSKMAVAIAERVQADQVADAAAAGHAGHTRAVLEQAADAAGLRAASAQPQAQVPGSSAQDDDQALLAAYAGFTTAPADVSATAANVPT